MIFKQSEQVLDGTKTQTRRVNFPYELAVQLWKRGWKYPRSRRYWDTYEHPWYVPWDEWQERHPISDEHIDEANRILAEHIITLPVVPKRGEKSTGRIHAQKIRRERLGDISEGDCLAEGVRHLPEDFHGIGRNIVRPTREIQERYARLWDDCGGNWEQDKDSDVWVLEFELSGSGRQ